MSATVSPMMARRYGVKRICDVLDFARSSFYWGRGVRIRPAGKRGPRPRWSDEELLEWIRRDLARSPFHGEGHRKVWARLKIVDGVRVSRKRVLRVMRENKLLSPYRVAQRTESCHSGNITTEAPDLMWGTDATKVVTLEDGYVWLFAAVDHCHAQCMGWHVSTSGSRFEALQALSMGLTEVFGGVGPDIARGLKLRMDHGTQYLSDHFLNQIRFWGMAASFAFVSEPETNGVVERFFRTLKEQAIYGRIFRNVEEVRSAVAKFVHDYNHHWRPEKLGFMTPVEYRKMHLQKVAA